MIAPVILLSFTLCWRPSLSRFFNLTEKKKRKEKKRDARARVQHYAVVVVVAVGQKSVVPRCPILLARSPVFLFLLLFNFEILKKRGMKKYRKSRTEQNRAEQSRAERFNMHMAVGLFVTATSKNKNNRSLAFALTHTMISSDVLSSLLFSFLFLFSFFYFGRDLSYFAAARCSLLW